MFAASGLALANWFPRIPETREALGLSYDALGLALFGLAAGAIIAMPVTGWLVSRIGSRGIGMVMGPAAMISLVLVPLAPNMPALAGALFLFGGFIGSMDVAMNSNGAAGEKRFGQPVLARLHGLFSGGTLIGAIMGGAAATAGIPLAIHLAVVGVALALLLILTCGGLVYDAPERASVRVGLALPRGPLIAIGVVAFAALLVEGAIGDWSAVYLRDRFLAGPDLAAAGYVIFAAAMTVSRFFGDWFIGKIGSTVTVMRGAGLLIVIGMTLVLAGSTPTWSLPGFFFVGAGAAMIFPLTIRAASDVGGLAAGAGIAAVTVAGYSGLLVGPPLIGLIAEGVGLRLALGLLLVLGLTVLVLARRVGRGQAG
ncbi:MAG: MFS transporter [Alphaproteobacteria bacterium]